MRDIFGEYMSDYFGRATLEDWLVEEVFCKEIKPEIVSLFEEWRIAVETDISNWMDSNDGYGHTVSWRGWGRGFNAIHDIDRFDKLVESFYEQK